MTGGKWTPGEWRVFGDPEDVPGIDATLPDGGVFSIVVYAEPDEDSDCGIRGRDMSEAWANARLIAAAPVMAQALRRLVYHYALSQGLSRSTAAALMQGKWADDAPDHVHPTLEEARAALALAEGDGG